MEKPNSVGNGGLKLPIGYRFHPTDEELVVHYLKRKVLGLPLPASVIPEFDVFQTDPHTLPGNLKEKRYFFSQKRWNEIGTKCKRRPSGYWKPIGKGKQIVDSARNQAIAIRKSLVFSEGKHSSNAKTQWFMHEYCLVGLAADPKTTQIKVGDWVAYSVSQRKRKPKKIGVISKPSSIVKTPNTEVIRGPNVMDFLTEDNSDTAGPPQPSSPCSSGVTEVSSNELDQEEISSFISFLS